jgi:hypothetical protein
MRKMISALLFVPAIMFAAGSLQAAPVDIGLQSLPPSMVKKVACGPFWGRWCGPRHHRVCNRWRCWCAHC